MDAMKDCGELGGLIRKERKNQGITQEELAALAGVGIRFVRELECGKETCRLGLALQVMRTLGLAFAVRRRGSQDGKASA